MKEKILQLRNEGKTYNEIKSILGCSKSTICYHCGDGQREKTRKRLQNRRKKSVILKRVEGFQYDRKIKDKAEDFQRKRIDGRFGERKLTFRWQDVIEKFGWETTCYLSGEFINLYDPKTYEFDHIIPLSKGGTGALDNLGITSKRANQAKRDMSVKEFLSLCRSILEHNGFKVSR